MNESIYDRLVAAARIQGAYEGWRNYRNSVTEYIVNSIDMTGIDNPVVCIFGAGEANDIDLALLSEMARLVLIDKDMDALVRAKERYKIEDAICADVPFWNIEEETCRMLEAMLSEGAEEEHIIDLLMQIGYNNSGSLKWDKGQFADISVAIGIHSQINAILAALVYYFKDNYGDTELHNITNAISALNVMAVSRLNDLIYKLTRHYFVFGYELLTVQGDTADALAIIKDIEDNSITNNSDICNRLHNVEGAKQLAMDISIHKDYDMEIVNNVYLPWNFSYKDNLKTYIMELLTCKKIF